MLVGRKEMAFHIPALPPYCGTMGSGQTMWNCGIRGIWTANNIVTKDLRSVGPEVDSDTPEWTSYNMPLVAKTFRSFREKKY